MGWESSRDTPAAARAERLRTDPRSILGSSALRGDGGTGAYGAPEIALVGIAGPPDGAQ
jgi:hypothetical protein